MDQSIRAIHEKVKQASVFVQALKQEIGKVIVGQEYLIERLLIGLLADGHVLLEGVPGLAKTLAVRAFLYPEPQFGRWCVASLERGHAKALLVVASSNHERKCIRFRVLHPLFASRNVFAPGRRFPAHESGDRRRDACENLFRVCYLKLAEL